MNRHVILAVTLAAGLPVTGLTQAQTPDRAHRTDDRLRLSTNGSTLSNSSGGGGASIGWLRNPTPGTVFGLAAEHQEIADSRWTFGSVTGALSLGQEGAQWNLYGEAHLGSGDNDGRDFDYQAVALGAVRTLTSRLSVQLEDRQIDIDRSHGNMPKLGFTYRITPRWLGALAYSRSIGGNLGTKLVTTRFDYYGSSWSFVFGGAGGRASPAVVNLQTGDITPGSTLREGFAGLIRPVGRFEWMVLGDYLEISNTERITLTVSCTIRLQAPPR